MRSLAASCSLLLITLYLGCSSGSQDKVVVYAALDREFSEPILADFSEETGISVAAEYDIRKNHPPTEAPSALCTLARQTRRAA